MSKAVLLTSRPVHARAPLKARITRTLEEHAQFILDWGIDVGRCFYRGGNGMVVHAQKKELLPADEEKEQPKSEVLVAKIFRSKIIVNQDGFEVGMDNTDDKGIQELYILHKLNQREVPHIPPVRAASWNLENHETILVIPFLGRNLKEHILYHKGPLPIDPITKIVTTVLHCFTKLIQICRTIKHGDLTVHNILLSSKEVSIIDWHGASTKTNYNLENVTTLDMRAPEVILRYGHYGREVDYWALGAIIIRIATGECFTCVENNDEELRQLHEICDRLNRPIPLDMQELSPVRNLFFDQQGLLKSPPLPRQPLPSFRSSFDRVKKTLISSLPQENPDRKRIAIYYDGLAKFADYLLELDPSSRPNDPTKISTHFIKLCIS